MPRVVLLGPVGGGKTLVLLAFAAFMNAALVTEWPIRDGATEPERRWPLDRARRVFLHAEGGTPRQALLSVRVELAKARRRHALTLVDTPGLLDETPDDPTRRRAMAATLRCAETAAMVLHVVDVSRMGRGSTLTAVDREVMEWMRPPRGYALLANKGDQPGAGAGLSRLKSAVPPGTPVVALSALTGQGLPALHRLLWRLV